MNATVNIVNEDKTTRFQPNGLVRHIPISRRWLDPLHLGDDGGALDHLLNRRLFKARAAKGGDGAAKEDGGVERGALHQLDRGVARDGVDGFDHVF